MDTFDEILKFAIESEYKAADFYKNMLTMNQAAGLHSVLKRLINQELGHASKLESILSKNTLPGKDVSNRELPLNMADYLVESNHDFSSLSYQDAIIIAMKREKAAVKMYQDLRDAADEPELKETFQFIMEEEISHETSFEEEYDRYIQSDN